MQHFPVSTVTASTPVCSLLELFQADVDEFCQYYGRRDAALCFPDFQRRQPQRQDSNYLEDEKPEDISRWV